MDRSINGRWTCDQDSNRESMIIESKRNGYVSPSNLKIRVDSDNRDKCLRKKLSTQLNV